MLLTTHEAEELYAARVAQDLTVDGHAFGRGAPSGVPGPLEGYLQRAVPSADGASDLMINKREIFISVDVETAGPIPGEFSLLSIGACDAYDDTRSFSVELKPINNNFDPKALEVTGLALEALMERGKPPEAAMSAFGAWASSLAGKDDTLVFVGFNAPFDWSFINYYFYRYMGSNPFGVTALDIKALYMGATRSSWADTRSSQIAKHLSPERRGDHDALHDARYQAELFRLVQAIEH